MSEKSATKSYPGTLEPRTLLILIVVQFLVQFFTSAYLYAYVANVESDLRIVRDDKCDLSTEHVGFIRRKRSSALPTAGDNTVSDVSRAREEKDPTKESKKVTASPTVLSGSSSTVTGGQDWVWLNADTRIQFDAIENFCRSSMKYCPPGQPGAPGSPGKPGERGLPGLQGMPGPEGPPGLPGVRGVRGPKGDPGPPGIDGRDGIPGEPGLDGIPGRSGFDGIPGINGKPGLDGSPGRPGRNGTDGRPGDSGPRGPAGPRGEVGPPGLRGPPGQDGRPGISAWKYDSGDHGLLIPPSILEDSSALYNRTVREGTNVRLRCAASGKPEPVIQWSKTDGTLIPVGSWYATSITGHTFNISVVTREHMGEYSCTADNGIPPSSSKNFTLSVKFSPFIVIRNQFVYVRRQNTAILECEVEAYPEPNMHWEREERFLKRADKYQIDILDRRNASIFKFRMRLKIFKITAADYGTYYCVAKNDVNTTKGFLIVYDNPESYGKQQYATYGEPMPKNVDIDNLCQRQHTCVSCAFVKCSYTDIGEYVYVQPFGNVNFSLLPPRLIDSIIEAAGKPVLKGNIDDYYGSWMQDASPLSNTTADYVWMTRRNDTFYLYQYPKGNMGSASQPIRLPYPFKGNGHVVYNGSFFYNPENRSSIVRYDIYSSGRGCDNMTMKSNKCELELPLLNVVNHNYLYTPGYNYVDFDVDESGLWVIYGLETNHTIVTKVDTVNMAIQYAWNISINHNKFGEMFIAGGVLYAIHNISEGPMKIRMAFDLYRNRTVDVELSFGNPYHMITSISYNYKNKEIYASSKGNILAYPIKFMGFANSSNMFRNNFQ